MEVEEAGRESRLIGISVTLVCLVGLLFAEKKNSTLLRILFKPAASTGFVWLGYLGNLDAATSLSYWGFVGLVLGWVGDVCLIAGGEGLLFLLGLGSFLAGHICYIVAFWCYGGVLSLEWTIAVGVVLVVQGILIFRWLYPHLKSDMVVPTTLYCIIITVMVVVASGMYAGGGFLLQHRNLLIGAILFYISDITVARDRFVSPGFINPLVGLPLYYLAQLIIATNLAS